MVKCTAADSPTVSESESHWSFVYSADDPHNFPSLLHVSFSLVPVPVSHQSSYLGLKIQVLEAFGLPKSTGFVPWAKDICIGAVARSGGEG